MKNRFLRGFVLCLTALVVILISSTAKTSVEVNKSLIVHVLGAIDRFYIEPKLAEPRKLLQESLLSLEKNIPEFIAQNKNAEKISLTMGLAQRTIQVGKLQNMQELANAMGTIAEFVSQNYTGELKSTEIEALMIDGMLNALDPHSNFLTKKIYNEFKVGTRGEFGGLGIVVTTKDGFLNVMQAIEGTPAYAAGIRSGDKIMQIGEESTINMSLTNAVNKLRGKVGTQVTISVDKNGKFWKKVTLTRAVINIDSVKSASKDIDGKKVAYIAVKSFQANTLAAVKAALATFQSDPNGISGLVLDLRNNPGGLLNVAVGLVDLFLKEGVIVTTVGQNDEVLETDSANERGTEKPYPLIVLINEGSASASEIVAGALKAQDRAIVMGEGSFGKGSVQTVFDLEGDTGLKLTISRYKPAGTISIQAEGVTPDVEIIPAIVTKNDVNLFPDKHFSEEDLDKHLAKIASTEKQKPIYEVRWLTEKLPEKENFEAEVAKEYSKTVDFEKDFTAKLAMNLIAKAGKPTRKEMITSVKAPIAEAKAAEQKKIDDALKTIGVDWNVVPSEQKPVLKLSSKILVNGVPIERAQAGKKIMFELTATNIGKGTFSGLIARGQSEKISFLANREFPFGLIKPQESKKFAVEIELPLGIPTQNLPMEVTFEEANNNVPQKTKVTLPVEAAPEPHFSISYKTSGFALAKPLAVNAPVSMTVNVMNDGTGATSAETIVSIADECEEKIFIEKGRVSIGAVPISQARSAELKFHMIEGYDPVNCALDLVVADVKRGTIASKRVKINPDQGAIAPAAGTKLATPQISVDKLPLESALEKIKISGKITDSDTVKDFFIFVNDDKLEYATNPEKSNSMNFVVDVPLKAGNNIITIGARDEQKMMGTTTVVIDRTEKQVVK